MKTAVLSLLVLSACASPTFAEVVRTDFDPIQHGFGFGNSFRNVENVAGIKVVTRGRCGGMVYAALDYYYARQRVPNETSPPDLDSPLAKYIYDRQLKSMTDMGDKFLTKIADQASPLTSNKSMFLSGIDYINGIRISVDKGRPIPVGLISAKPSVDGNHQVLAIGYETHPDPHLQKVLVYDPNRPGVVTIISPDPPNDVFRDQHGKVWRTLSNSDAYEPRRPVETWRPSLSAGMSVTTSSAGSTLIWRGVGGGIGSTAVGPDGKWLKSYPIAPANAAREGSPTAIVVADGGTVHNFWIGPDGGIGTTFAGPGMKHVDAFPIAPSGAARADSPLAAVYRGRGQIDVFWIGPDGAVAGTFRANGAWAAPFPITPPGAAGASSGLAALCRDEFMVEAFWVGGDGRIATTFSNHAHDGGRWATPFPISPVNAARKGSAVAAVSVSAKEAQVFWIGPDGGIGTSHTRANENDGKWCAPYPIAAPNAARNDSPLVAVSRKQGSINVAWIGRDGAVGGVVKANDRWQKPFALTPPSAAGQGSTLGLTSRLPNWLDLFYIGNDGAVATASWSASANEGRWQAPFPLTKPGEAVR